MSTQAVAPRGDGLLLGVRSESLVTIGLTESIHSSVASTELNEIRLALCPPYPTATKLGGAARFRDGPTSGVAIFRRVAAFSWAQCRWRSLAEIFLTLSGQV